MEHSPIRILHIEDDPEWRDIVHRRFSDKKGVTLDQARTIDVAQDKIQNAKYDLILADLGMGRRKKENISTALADFDSLMFGIGTLRGTENLEDRPRIVILTGHLARADDVQSAVNKYPGWIWGWLGKLNFDDEEVDKVIGDIRRHRKHAERLVYGGKWQGSALQLIVYLLGVVVLLSVYMLTNDAGIAVISTVVPLILMLIIQIYYLRINKQLSDKSYAEIVLELIRQVFARKP